jgi:tRNA pseudouridine synthase 10
MLKNLKILQNNFVRVNDPSGKSSEKKIFSLSHKKISKNSFSLSLKVEGGLPIKRFVNGDDVLPNLSKLLGISCVCKEFDFLDVSVQ